MKLSNRNFADLGHLQVIRQIAYREGGGRGERRGIWKSVKTRSWNAIKHENRVTPFLVFSQLQVSFPQNNLPKTPRTPKLVSCIQLDWDLRFWVRLKESLTSKQIYSVNKHLQHITILVPSDISTTNTSNRLYYVITSAKSLNWCRYTVTLFWQQKYINYFVFKYLLTKNIELLWVLNNNKLINSKESTSFSWSFQDSGAADQQGDEEFYEATSKTFGR